MLNRQSALVELNAKLREIVNTLQVKFLNVKETGEESDFFKDVKPFTDEVKAVTDEWQSLAGSWIMEEKPKYIYKQQVDSTVENIELISVQAFYSSTSKSRFINYVQSIEFVLNGIDKELNKKAP